ncbi:MAG: SDR family NAD(P)-dependent oxidoreductase [Desulfobacterales bacterium]|nr:SDR family NAD(P)-dependent oxidoreductase [Desulfobacterales bacterium]
MKALITGTSSGIGNGLAREYLNRNAHVWGISRRIPNDIINDPNYHHLQLDLTNYHKVKQEVPGFLKGQNHFDIIILNSGILGEIRFTKDVAIEQMKEVMEINVWANKSLLDLMYSLDIKIKQVVGMSSGAALRSTPGWGSYALSKAGLDMLINIYAKERPETHFSAFAPGLVDSEIQEYIYSIKDTEKYPSAKKLQDARYSDVMPDAITAAPTLIEGMEKALNFESGSHVDVREI